VQLQACWKKEEKTEICTNEVEKSQQKNQRKKNQVKTLQLKNTVTEVKVQWMNFNTEWRRRRKSSEDRNTEATPAEQWRENRATVKKQSLRAVVL
jgi:hypothetical protein